MFRRWFWLPAVLAACSAPRPRAMDAPLRTITEGRGKEAQAIARELDRLGIRKTEQDFETHGISFRNVVGKVGSGRRVIILGAHHDAVEGSPGADDNASGVVVLLELAARFKERPIDATVLFIFFGAEEKGTWGSLQYVRHPVLPLDRTVAMINMDMVGRLRESLAVIGVDTATEWNGLLDKVSGKDLVLKRGKGGVGPSDHTPFYLRGIPVLHLFTGAHEDYHRSTDTMDKVNIAGMSLIADFVERLVRVLPEKMTYQKSSVEIEPIRVPRSEGGKPYLGIIPNYLDEGKGVLLEGVRTGSPAEKAGLKAGDRILAYGGAGIADIRAYSQRFFAARPGQVVELTVSRGRTLLKVSVTIGSRP